MSFGLNIWKNSPDGKIIASDVIVAKNYLTKDELKSLERIVTMYLDYAEDQAERRIPMTMEDWKRKLDIFLYNCLIFSLSSQNTSCFLNAVLISL